jgi:putative effector of murein hydrolase
MKILILIAILLLVVYLIKVIIKYKNYYSKKPKQDPNGRKKSHRSL